MHFEIYTMNEISNLHKSEIEQQQGIDGNLIDKIQVKRRKKLVKLHV